METLIEEEAMSQFSRVEYYGNDHEQERMGFGEA